MFNVQQAMQMIQQMQNNPQMILQKFGIPQDLKSPNEVTQYLLNSGRVNQSHIDQARSIYKQFFR